MTRPIGFPDEQSIATWDPRSGGTQNGDKLWKMTYRAFNLPILALLVTLPLLAGCAAAAPATPIAASATATPTATPTVEPTVEAIVEPVADPNCFTVSAVTIASIQTGVGELDGGREITGNTLTRAVAYKSGDRPNVFFIAGEIAGPGLNVGQANALWATNGDPVHNTTQGIMFSVNSWAEGYSDWADGSLQKLTQFESGAKEALECLEALQK